MVATLGVIGTDMRAASRPEGEAPLPSQSSTAAVLIVGGDRRDFVSRRSPFPAGGTDTRRGTQTRCALQNASARGLWRNQGNAVDVEDGHSGSTRFSPVMPAPLF